MAPPRKDEERKARQDFIQANWQSMSDEEMAIKLNIQRQSVVSERMLLGISRRELIDLSKERVKQLLELFANGKSMAEISRIMNLNHYRIQSTIDKIWFYKKRSYNTITLVMDSKIKYEM